MEAGDRTMKLGKTSWIILTAGILIVAFASLGAARYQQLHQQNQLEDELSVAELRLDKSSLKQLYTQQDELEKQLGETAIQLKIAKDNLTQSIESIDVTDSLFEIAEACGVEIIEIGSSGVASGELKGIDCFATRLAIRVEGNVPNLIGFITKLNNDFISGLVESAEISISGMIDEGNGSSANIRLVVYTYQDQGG